ncbi:MAG: hypothetical protein ACYSWW_27895 [Planctomycetota bacterium]|jgi:hypothetical protein
MTKDEVVKWMRKSADSLESWLNSLPGDSWPLICEMNAIPQKVLEDAVKHFSE